MPEAAWLDKVGKPVLGVCMMLWFIGELLVKVGAIAPAPTVTVPEPRSSDMHARQQLHDIDARTERIEGDLDALVRSVQSLVTNLTRDREDRRRNVGG
jgi:hypothetical protein